MEIVRTGKSCSLIRFHESFVNDLHIAANNPNVAKSVLSIPVPFTLENAEKYIADRLTPNVCAICVGAIGTRVESDIRKAHIAKIGFVFSTYHFISLFIID
eukprot:TRINITY_DN14199_c0_g1_i1.p1 TRINITY_DN14199_c0_g1~~TRINITY_DN14199_c0_g1_i1.p1  ORF type:complete len:101 (-),score=12.02 TRINITY_DN14199_c0_g1_i1:210-512(-)